MAGRNGKRAKNGEKKKRDVYAHAVGEQGCTVSALGHVVVSRRGWAAGGWATHFGHCATILTSCNSVIGDFPATTRVKFAVLSLAVGFVEPG